MIGVYFSGTGNTKYCISKFMEKTKEKGKIISIEDSGVIKAIKDNEFIIFAYPIYFSNIPKIVRDFVENNREIFKNKKIYIIATMGLFSGDGTGCLARILKKEDAKIIGGLHLKMPDCIGDEKLLKKSLEENKLLVKNAIEKIAKAAKNLNEEKPDKDGLYIFNQIVGLLGQRLWFYNKTKYYTDKAKINKEKCIACGKCIELCPMKNLKLKDNEIITQGRCTLCYRCFSNCPKQAITILGKRVYDQCNIDNYK